MVGAAPFGVAVTPDGTRVYVSSLTNGGGIRIGTSFNSLGTTRVSEISVLSPEQAKQREDEIDLYLRREKREHNRNKLRYILFTL